MINMVLQIKKPRTFVARKKVVTKNIPNVHFIKYNIIRERQNRISLQKTSFVYLTKEVFYMEQGTGIDLHLLRK